MPPTISGTGASGSAGTMSAPVSIVRSERRSAPGISPDAREPTAWLASWAPDDSVEAEVVVEAEDDACSADCERARTRDAIHARALRDTPASPPWARARGVSARRSAPREPAATSTQTLCDRPAWTFPRGRTGAHAAPDDALAPIPPRAADAGMGTPRERAGIAIAPVGGRACVRERRFALPTGWVFRTARFSRGVSHDREPHTTRDEPAARARVSSSASRRGDFTELSRKPRHLRRAPRSVRGNAQCVPKPV